MLARIMCIGPRRLYEAACVLSFDYNIQACIDETYIISFYRQQELIDCFRNFGIDYSKFIFIHDSELTGLDAWQTNTWYFQQAAKLHMLDTIDSECFLIQDSDLLCLKPYRPFQDGKPVFRVEGLWNPFQSRYAEGIQYITGLKRQIEYSFVTEIMPYTKQDWLGCRQLIADRFGGDWRTAIPEQFPLNDDQWFSEYELLGIYKTNQDPDYYVDEDINVVIKSWSDLDGIDWSVVPTLKFKDRPLKFMTEAAARELVARFEPPVV